MGRRIHRVKDSGLQAEVSDVAVLSGAEEDWRARSRSVQRHVDRLREEGSDVGPNGPPRWHPPLGAEQLGGWGLAVEHVGLLARAPSHS